MDQYGQGKRRASAYNAGPQLPNYMKQAASAAARKAPGQQRPAAGASGGRRTTSQRGHGGGRRRRTTNPQKLLRLALILFGVLLFAAAGIFILTSGTRQNPSMQNYIEKETRFLKGVSIEGVDVSDKTITEVKPLVQQAVSQKMGKVSFLIAQADKSWTLTASDMQMTAGTDDILTQAMSYGRTGSITENAQARGDLSDGKNFTVPLAANATALRNRLVTISAEANQAAVEPHAIPTLDDSNKAHFQFEEGQNGYTLNTEKTAAVVEQMITAENYQGPVTPVFDTVAPTLTLDFIKQNTQRISTFTTRFPQSSTDEIIQNRVFNIRKASGIINCTVVQPDEEWSYNNCVGLRTEKGGWKLANGISNGKEYTLQAGGGVCQVSTTLYNALLCGNITITDRAAHSIPSTYVPKGLDATVDSSGIDLKFKNDTGAPMYLFLYITKDKDSSRYLNLTVSIYGKSLPDGVTYKVRSEITETTPHTDDIKITKDPTIPTGYQLEKVTAHDGFHAVAYREKYVDGKLTDTEKLHEDTYDGNAAEVAVGTGDPLLPVPDGATLVDGATPPVASGVTPQPGDTGGDTAPSPTPAT